MTFNPTQGSTSTADPRNTLEQAREAAATGESLAVLDEDLWCLPRVANAVDR